jgi:hypothetical protein
MQAVPLTGERAVPEVVERNRLAAGRAVADSLVATDLTEIVDVSASQPASFDAMTIDDRSYEHATVKRLDSVEVAEEINWPSDH